MGRQHQRVDLSRLQQQSESSRRPSEMAEDCRRCQPWCPYDPDGSGTQVTGKDNPEFGEHGDDHVVLLRFDIRVHDLFGLLSQRHRTSGACPVRCLVMTDADDDRSFIRLYVYTNFELV